MRNYFYSIVFLVFALGMNSQTKNHPVGISAGFGYQWYKGDLGNGFYRVFNTCSFGAARLTLDHYINSSFDAGLMGTLGDFGYFQPPSVANTEVVDDDRCPGCDRVGLGNLSSRLAAAGVSIKYKLANGYLLKEDSKIAPYIYAGASINHITDRMKMNCVQPGNYFSLNAGFGVKYNINNRFNAGLNIGGGYFTSDKLDFLVRCNKDMYLQNTLTLGINIF